MVWIAEDNPASHTYHGKLHVVATIVGDPTVDFQLQFQIR